MNAPAALGELLVATRLVTADQLRIAVLEQQRSKRPLAQLVVELGFVSATALRDTLAARSGHASIELDGCLVDPAALALVPARIARRHRVLPLRFEAADQRLVVATANADDIVALDRLRAELGSAIRLELRIASEAELEQAIADHYGDALSVEDLLREIEQRGESAPGRGDHRERGRPVTRLVDALLAEAVMRGASDLHFEPEDAYLRIRERIDGNLRQVRAVHKSFWPELAVRLKVLAGLDIAESRMPQNGRMSMRCGGRAIDFRVATQPTLHGENIVLRILDREKGIVPLAALGLDEHQHAALARMLARPEGLVLVTGPTGSGKTTTLYSILSHLNSETVNIMTLEDPVEYPLAQIRQTAIGDGSRFSFADGVRALLRQDPDILLIGEIRDADTAQMALRAALTGHRVFSTLHANSAAGAIPRLLDVGVRAELLAGNLSGIIAQRLVRRLCPSCRQPRAPTAEESRLLGPACAQAAELFSAGGCTHCQFTGYRGRCALFELLPIDPELDELIATAASLGRLRAALGARGHRGLADAGRRRVLEGSTTLSEVLRVVDLAAELAPEASPT